jgi:hypothetical protein
MCALFLQVVRSIKDFGEIQAKFYGGSEERGGYLVRIAENVTNSEGSCLY